MIVIWIAHWNPRHWILLIQGDCQELGCEVVLPVSPNSSCSVEAEILQNCELATVPTLLKRCQMLCRPVNELRTAAAIVNRVVGLLQVIQRLVARPLVSFHIG